MEMDSPSALGIYILFHLCVFCSYDAPIRKKKERCGSSFLIFLDIINTVFGFGANLVTVVLIVVLGIRYRNAGVRRVCPYVSF